MDHLQYRALEPQAVEEKFASKLLDKLIETRQPEAAATSQWAWEPFAQQQLQQQLQLTAETKPQKNKRIAAAYASWNIPETYSKALWRSSLELQQNVRLRSEARAAAGRAGRTTRKEVAKLAAKFVDKLSKTRKADSLFKSVAEIRREAAATSREEPFLQEQLQQELQPAGETRLRRNTTNVQETYATRLRSNATNVQETYAQALWKSSMALQRDIRLRYEARAAAARAAKRTPRRAVASVAVAVLTKFKKDPGRKISFLVDKLIETRKAEPLATSRGEPFDQEQLEQQQQLAEEAKLQGNKEYANSLWRSSLKLQQSIQKRTEERAAAARAAAARAAAARKITKRVVTVVAGAAVAAIAVLKVMGPLLDRSERTTQASSSSEKKKKTFPTAKLALEASKTMALEASETTTLLMTLPQPEVPTTPSPTTEELAVPPSPRLAAPPSPSADPALSLATVSSQQQVPIENAEPGSDTVKSLSKTDDKQASKAPEREKANVKPFFFLFRGIKQDSDSQLENHDVAGSTR